MIRTLCTVFAALLGLAFGSFMNVCLSRWPEGESVVKPRSHCRNCGHVLAWWENVPLVSWLALGGRCRLCRTWISWRYVAVEVAVGALWGLVAWKSFDAFFPLEFSSGMMFLMWLLIVLAFLDAEHLWLPNMITLPGIGAGILWRFIQGEQIRWALHIPGGTWESVKELGKILLVVVAAAGLIVLIRWVYWLIRKQEGIGLGDAKLMALLGAWLGLKGVLLSFALGVVLGAFVAVVMLVLPRLRRSKDPWSASQLPLGTFLCIGGIVTALWGQQIVRAYKLWAGL